MKAKLLLKKAILEKCLSLKTEELTTLKESQKQQLESASTEDIDQYNMTDSPREVIMQQIEDIAASLDFLADQINVLKNILQSLPMDGLHDRVSLGSVVYTTKGNFLVAIAQAPFQLHHITYQGISTKSPLFEKIKGLSKGEMFDTVQKVIDVF